MRRIANILLLLASFQLIFGLAVKDCFNVGRDKNQFEQLSKYLANGTSLNNIIGNPEIFGGKSLLDLALNLIHAEQIDKEDLCVEKGRKIALDLHEALKRSHLNPLKSATYEKKSSVASKLAIDYLEKYAGGCMRKWWSLTELSEKIKGDDYNFDELARQTGRNCVRRSYKGKSPDLRHLSCIIERMDKNYHGLFVRAGLYNALYFIHVAKTGAKSLEYRFKGDGWSRLKRRDLEAYFTKYLWSPCGALTADRPDSRLRNIAEALKMVRISDKLFGKLDDKMSQIVRWTTHYAACKRLDLHLFDELMEIIYGATDLDEYT